MFYGSRVPSIAFAKIFMCVDLVFIQSIHTHRAPTYLPQHLCITWNMSWHITNAYVMCTILDKSHFACCGNRTTRAAATHHHCYHHQCCWKAIKFCFASLDVTLARFYIYLLDLWRGAFCKPDINYFRNMILNLSDTNNCNKIKKRKSCIQHNQNNGSNYRWLAWLVTIVPLVTKMQTWTLRMRRLHLHISCTCASKWKEYLSLLLIDREAFFILFTWF
jgi:hypothetical protein